LASSLEGLDDDHPAATARARERKYVGFLGIALNWRVGVGAMDGDGQ
jgi:hypothetical protein